MGLFDRASDAPVDVERLARDVHNALTSLRESIDKKSEDTLARRNYVDRRRCEQCALHLAERSHHHIEGLSRRLHFENASRAPLKRCPQSWHSMVARAWLRGRVRPTTMQRASWP